MLSKVLSVQTPGRNFSQFYTTKINPELNKVLMPIGGEQFLKRLDEIKKNIILPDYIKTFSTSSFDNETLTLAQIKQDVAIVHESLEKALSKSDVLPILYSKDLKQLSHAKRFLENIGINENKPYFMG